jgi:hypothetical protein
MTRRTGEEQTGSSTCEPLKIRFFFLSYYHILPSHHLHSFHYQLRLHFYHNYFHPILIGFSRILHEELIIIQLANKFLEVYCRVDNSPFQEPVLTRMSSVYILIPIRTLFKVHCITLLPSTLKPP